MKPEQYPKLIDVAGVQYHVVFVRKLMDRDTLGMCDDDAKVIYLVRGQDQDELMATFWHELLHAFEFECGSTLGHPVIRKLEYVLASAHRQLSGGAKE